MKKILIANVGSTSYKNTLFGISESGECTELFRSGIERVSDFESAIRESLEALEKAGFSPDSVDAVAFKTVLGKDLSGLREADDNVLEALEAMSFVAPAHNPPYAAAIRAFKKVLPRARRIALFETSFFQWAAPEWKRYAVPKSWDEIGIRRNGFQATSTRQNALRSCAGAQMPQKAQSTSTKTTAARNSKLRSGSSTAISEVLRRSAEYSTARRWARAWGLVRKAAFRKTTESATWIRRFCRML